MNRHFILKGHDVVACDDLMTWAGAFEQTDRKVAFTKLPGSEVSTVFLGLDHRYGPAGPPLVFETMVFGGVLDDETARYSTWAEAEAGHAAMVERVRHTLAASFAPSEFASHSDVEIPDEHGGEA